MRKDVRTGTAIGAGVVVVSVVGWIVLGSHGHKSQKDQASNTPAKTAPNTADQTPSPDHPAGGDPLLAAGHEDAGSGHDASAAPTPAAPIPSHSDMTDAARGHGATDWHTLLSAETPVFPKASDLEHMAAESPGSSTGDAPAGDGVINTADRSNSSRLGDSPVPSPDNTTSARPAAARAERLADSTGAAGASSTTAETHKVLPGETFSSISRAVYGDAKYYKQIVKANPSVDPSHLRPGMLISLPDKAALKSADAPRASSSATPSETRRRASASARAIDSQTEYRVQSNDNLYRISMRLYNSPNRVDAIYQLNKEAIGTDPAKLKLNMVLKLPAPPVSASASH